MREFEKQNKTTKLNELQRNDSKWKNLRSENKYYHERHCENH